MPRVLAVSCMKNEGPFILEWVAHHRAIGVTDFLIYTNDCDDGTDAIWQRLEALGLGQHRENVILRRGVQKSALYHARTEQVVKDADWHLVMDVDEFINIHAGEGHLADLFAACPEATTIAMTWRVFGDGGNIAYRDAPLMADFTRAAPLHMPRPAQAWGVKTLFQNAGLYERMGVHVPLSPVEAKRDQIVLVNGSGSVLPEAAKDGAWRSTEQTVGYDLVQLNHYAVRSVESFLVKRDRGRVNHMDHDQGLAYWQMMSHCQEPDTSIARRLPAMQAELDRLLADPELARLHDEAVAWHRAKIRELKTRPDFAALFDAIVYKVATRDPVRAAS